MVKIKLRKCSSRYFDEYMGKFLKFPLAILKRMLYNAHAPAGVMELVDVVDSKSTAGDSVPVRVRPPAPINPIVNDTFTMGFIFVPVGLEPQVRVWGARGALPVADEATRASGSGRRGTKAFESRGHSSGTATGHRHIFTRNNGIPGSGIPLLRL